MLEWYRLGWDHHRLVDETADLILQALALVDRGATLQRVRYRDLYHRELGLDPEAKDWLAGELASPASVDSLVAAARTPELAATTGSTC